MKNKVCRRSWTKLKSKNIQASFMESIYATQYDSFWTTVTGIIINNGNKVCQFLAWRVLQIFMAQYKIRPVRNNHFHLATHVNNARSQTHGSQYLLTVYIVTCRGCAWLIDGFWNGWLDLMTPHTQHSELQAVTALLMIYTLYSSPLHTH
jgi:hypothetical protein